MKKKQRDWKMKVKKVKKRDRIVEIKPQRLNRQIRDQKP